MTAASTLRWLALLGLLCGTAVVHAQATAPSSKARTRSLHPTALGARLAAALPPASAEQLAAATRAFVGAYACEFDQSVTVTSNERTQGYVDVSFGKSRWTMKPVLSSTGALRLEDVKGRMLLLQIATKSMLMDTVAGRRTIDNCVHEQQRHVAQPSLSQSLGIDPALAAAAAAAGTAAGTTPGTTPGTTAGTTAGALAASPPGASSTRLATAPTLTAALEAEAPGP